MPYIVDDERTVTRRFSRRTTYMIANPHDGVVVGAVVLLHPGKNAEKQTFFDTSGNKLRSRTQIRGMLQAVINHRAPKPPVEVNFTNPWGDPVS